MFQILRFALNDKLYNKSIHFLVPLFGFIYPKNEKESLSLHPKTQIIIKT